MGSGTVPLPTVASDHQPLCTSSPPSLLPLEGTGRSPGYCPPSWTVSSFPERPLREKGWGVFVSPELECSGSKDSPATVKYLKYVQNHVSVHSSVTTLAHSLQHIDGSNLGSCKSQSDCFSQCVVASQRAPSIQQREQLRNSHCRQGLTRERH